jgi:hypothetical protein
MPGAGRAFVEEAKLGYLLRAEERGVERWFLRGHRVLRGASRNPETSPPGSRAAVRRFPDRRDRIRRKIRDLRFVAKPGRAKSGGSEFRSVWIEEFGSGRPRFITAYPGEKKR